MTEIDKNKQQPQKRKTEIESQMSNTPANKTVAEAIVRGILGDFTKLFDEISNEKRKQLVYAVIKKIIVTQDRKVNQIELKFDKIHQSVNP